MSRPSLLLVDDSEAILAFERGVLGSHYTLHTARDGHEALDALARALPDAVVLDLSMPGMDGEEVLERMRDDARLRQVPVLIVSSEAERAEACLRKGASATVPKPIRPDDLRSAVARVLDQSEARKRQGSLACLPVEVGGVVFALPLDAVRRVVARPALRPIATGPEYMNELLELHGRPICVLDMAVRLGLEHEENLIEQKLVVARAGSLDIALCLDDVHDPEEIPAGDMLARDGVGGSHHGELQRTLIGVARTSRGQTPVIDPSALVSPDLLEALVNELREAAVATGEVP